MVRQQSNLSRVRKALDGKAAVEGRPNDLLHRVNTCSTMGLEGRSHARREGGSLYPV
jgi:hypothetical protein